MQTQTYKTIVYGNCQSKANSRRIVLIHNAPRVIKSKQALAFADAIDKQVKVEPFLEGHLSAHIKIFYKDRRPDLDPSLVLDGLQGKWFKNDRQIIRIHCERYLDKEDPRVEVEITEVEWDEWQPEKNQNL